MREVTSPTLLIVGGEDQQVLELNRQASLLLAGPHQIAVIPGAGHLFEEPGTLTQVADLAAAWFSDKFADATSPRADPTAAGRRR